MFKCVVKMFGIPYDISNLREIEIELRNGANLRDVIAALRKRIPSLEGSVIYAGEDRLVESYQFNVNGRFYFGNADFQFEIKSGDNIALLTTSTGG
jgi:molybdopterin converting factor small subunit